MAGETNTASNIGPGSGLFATKVGVDLEFKTLTSENGTILYNSFSDHVNLDVNINSIATGLTNIAWVPSTGAAYVSNIVSVGNPSDGQELLASPKIVSNSIQLKRIKTIGELNLSVNGTSIILSPSANVCLLNTPQTRTTQIADGINNLNIVSGSVTWDFNTGNTANLLLTGNTAILNPINILPGARYVLFVKQDNIGNRVVTWDTLFRWQTGQPPMLTSTANGIDIIEFKSDGLKLYGKIYGSNFL